MLSPVRRTAQWLGGRVVLFAIVVVALLAWQAYRTDFALAQRLLAGAPSVESHAAEIARVRAELERHYRDEVARVNAQLAAATDDTEQKARERADSLSREIGLLEAQRRPALRRSLALATGDGLEDDLRLEARIQLAQAEREQWLAFAERLERGAWRAEDEAAVARARFEIAVATYRDYRRAHDALIAYRQQYRLVPTPVLESLPEYERLDDERIARLDAYREARQRWRDAVAARDVALRALGVTARKAIPVDLEFLRPLDDAKSARVRVREVADDAWTRVRGVLWTALAAVVLITLAPVFVKAFWYYAIAPWAAGRAPFRLRAPPARPQPALEPVRSAVSLRVRLRADEELLVHPEYLQSSAERGEKRTQWLLSARFPVSSVASGMVVLTRIRDASGEDFVVSSKTDPWAEVTSIPLGEGEAFVLQPRHLVGIVQRTAQPVRITRRWVFRLSSFITLQFRYVIFEGPGSLIVQGTRGVRVEPVGAGRSVDQAMTIGFSAHTCYGTARSETFGAYLLGVRGLFNDRFSGGTGVVAYEEMPLTNGRPGITGRGLEGLTDALLKAVGL